MRVLIAYDVADDDRRNSLARLLASYGFRYQRSVFFIPSISKKELEKLINRLKPLINPKTDRLKCYQVEKVEYHEGFIWEPWENFKVF